MSVTVATKTIHPTSANQTVKPDSKPLEDFQAWWRGETPAPAITTPAVSVPVSQTEALKTEIPTWTPERKGVVDGGFDRMGEDAGGTILWGYYHDAGQAGPSYFLASETDRKTGTEAAVYCSCPSYKSNIHKFAARTPDVPEPCKHMKNLTASLAD